MSSWYQLSDKEGRVSMRWLKNLGAVRRWMNFTGFHWPSEDILSLSSCNLSDSHMEETGTPPRFHSEIVKASCKNSVNVMLSLTFFQRKLTVQACSQLARDLHFRRAWWRTSPHLSHFFNKSLVSCMLSPWLRWFTWYSALRRTTYVNPIFHGFMVSSQRNHVNTIQKNQKAALISNCLFSIVMWHFTGKINSSVTLIFLKK